MRRLTENSLVISLPQSFINLICISVMFDVIVNQMSPVKTTRVKDVRMCILSTCINQLVNCHHIQQLYNFDGCEAPFLKRCYFWGFFWFFFYRVSCKVFVE